MTDTREQQIAGIIADAANRFTGDLITKEDVAPEVKRILALTGERATDEPEIVTFLQSLDDVLANAPPSAFCRQCREAEKEWPIRSVRAQIASALIDLSATVRCLTAHPAENAPPDELADELEIIGRLMQHEADECPVGSDALVEGWMSHVRACNEAAARLRQTDDVVSKAYDAGLAMREDGPGEPVAYSPLQDFAHGMFEGADPRQGMPGWEADDDPMVALKGWQDVPEGHSWFRQMIVDYLWANKNDENPPDESTVSGVALYRRAPKTAPVGERIDGAVNADERLRGGYSVKFWPHEDGSLNPLKRRATLIIHGGTEGETPDV